MRLKALLLAAALATPGASRGQAAIPVAARASGDDLLARGDALRRRGDLAGALAAFEAARAAGLDGAELWKRIAWTQRALRRPASAAAALRRALAADPADREAADDLADLERSRGLRLDGWLGGDEPGTSRNAANAELFYGGLDRLELKGGYGWTDAVYYQSHKAFAAGYWFYGPGSYLMADATVRRYLYRVDPAVQRPNPDSSSYRLVPRGTLEVSHAFTPALRATVGYQVYLPNFDYDPASRVVNHKLYGELSARLGAGLQAGLALAVLRDPDPARTDILGRSHDPLVDCSLLPRDPGCATATRVVYRVEPMLGGFLGFQAARWSAEVRGLPNRDLDASYAFSLLSSVNVRPLERLEAQLQWILDWYSAASSHPNRTGAVYWASGRYDLLPSLSLGGGVKVVSNPSRSGPTLLLVGAYRTGLF